MINNIHKKVRFFTRQIILCLVVGVTFLGPVVSAQGLSSAEYCAQRGITNADACNVFLRKAGYLFIGTDNGSDNCSNTTATTAAGSAGLAAGTKVYVLGDSITNMSKAEIQTQITAAGFTVSSINSDPGRAISVDTAGSDPPGLQAISNDQAIVKDSGAIVIALGTNSGTEDLNVQIPALMGKIRDELKATAPVFWVNLFYTKGSGSATRNAAIEANSKGKNPYTIIDTTTAGIELGSDKTHPTAAGIPVFAKTIADGLKAYSGTGTQQALTGASYDPLSLTFPDFPDATAMGAAMTKYLKDNYPTTPWLTIDADVGGWLVRESKSRNINPLLIFSIGKQENGFGKSGGIHVTKYYNYFGMKGSGPVVVPNSAYKGFASPVDGITYFLNALQKNINGPDRGQYAAVSNFYEYLAMHQSGIIKYPGDDLDPTDSGGPVFDGNGNWIKGRSTPDGNRKNGYDPAMGVYTSWEPIVHPNKAYNKPDGSANPSSVFNPGGYFKNSVALINKLTGLNLSDMPTKGAGALQATTTCTTVGTGAPLPAGPNGYDLKDTGPNPMIFYSQHTSGSDPAVTGYFGSSPYGTGTVADCGCGPTSFAIIVSTLTGTKVEPPEMAKWAADNNFQQAGCGSSWWWQDNPALVKQKWGVDVENLNLDFAKAKTALADGKLIIMSAGGGNVFVSGTEAEAGHIFVMRAFTNDGKFLFADPSSEGDKKNRPEFAPLKDVSRTPIAEDVIATHLKGMWAISKAAQ